MTKLLSTEDVAEMLGVTRSTIMRWIREGTLNASKPGAKYYITEEDVQEMLRNSRKAGGKSGDTESNDAG
jgi:excisionase family DNA binding protein